MNYSKAVSEVNKAKKALEQFEGLCLRVHGLQLRFEKEYDGTNRFVGYDSAHYNNLHRNHLKNIKNVEQVAHDLRPEHIKIQEFVSKVKEHKKYCDKILSFYHDNLISKLEQEIITKYSYCVDITTGPKPKCVHRDCGRIVKCNCRPGKKDSSKLVLSDELISDESSIRRYLVVRRDGIIIYINPDMSPDDIRRNIRENIRGSINDYINSNSGYLSNAFNEAHTHVRNTFETSDARHISSDVLSNGFLPLNLGFCMALSSALNAPDELRSLATLNMLRLSGELNQEIRNIEQQNI